MVQKHHVIFIRLHFKNGAGTFFLQEMQVLQPIQVNGLLCSCKRSLQSRLDVNQALERVLYFTQPPSTSLIKKF